jgi:two-component system NarL family response regulator
MQTTRHVTVLLVEDHELMRFGLKSMLNAMDGAVVVGETDNGVEALQLVSSLKPDLVLMDLMLHGSDGIATTKEIKQMAPETLVLAFTSVNTREKLLAAMTAGADGYCLKTSPSNVLITAIATVLGGDPWIDPDLAGELYQDYGLLVPELPPAPVTLTPRELEILRLIMQGLTNPKIAQELFVSIETVKTHIKHILEKLSATDRTQAAVEAMKRGLI